MQKINDRIQEVLKQHKTKKQYLFVLFLLSAMVIAAVCFSLMTPAVSMSGQLVCTKVPHSHGDACYERHLICNENTESHTHSDDCYTTEAVLQCENTDKGHEHTEECYKEEKVLTCGLEETAAHEHTQDCYEVELVCDREVHEHSHACFSGDAGIAVIMFDDEEEQTAVMPVGIMKNEYSINDNDIFNLTDKAVDFGDLITSIEHREVDDVIRAEHNKDDANLVDYYYRNVDFTIKYKITRTHLTSNDPNNRQIYCNLPNDIIIRGIRQGDVVKDGRTIGKYDIANDNTVIIVFNDDFVTQGENIEGDIEFNADVKKLDDNNGFENVKIGNADVEIPFADMSVSKSNKEIESDEDGFVKAEYTVTVNSNHGSGNGNITLTDGLINNNANNDEIKIERDSIKIVKNNSNGSSEVVSNPNFTDDMNFTISGLDALNKNESYTITYTVSMKPEAATVKLDTTNTATVTNGKITSSATSSFKKDVGCDIEKSGSYDDKTEKLVWEVIVKNPSGLSLEGYTVTDQMLKDATNIKIEQKGNDNNWQFLEQIDRNNPSGKIGTFDANTNTFTFNEVFESSYKLTYEFDVTEEWLNGVDSQYKEHNEWNNWDTIKNIAILTPPGDNPIVKKGEGTANVTARRNNIKKNKGTVTHDEQKNAIIPWTVNLEGVLGKFSNQTFTDVMTDSDNGNYHYMTVDQLRELKVYGQFEKTYTWGGVYKDWGLLTIGSDYTVIVNGTEINSSSDFDQLNGNITTFNIRFKDSENIKSQSDIKIEYSTMGIVKDIPVNNSRIYTNTATFKEKSFPATHEEQNKPPIYKFDTRDPNKSSTDHNLNDIIVDDKYTLKWYIDVDPSLCDLSDNRSVVLIDTLPNGTSLNEDSVLYGDQKQIKGQGFTVNGQEITFTIPQSIHNGQKISIYYDVIISDSAVPQVDDEECSFENIVRAGSYETKQKQTIKKVPLDKLNKIGPSPMDVYNGHLNYTVDINPTGEMINSGNPITIVDTISQAIWWWGRTCNFTLDSLSINIIEKDGVRTPLTAAEYTLSPLMEEGQYADKFILEGLPDGKHIEINYMFTGTYTEVGAEHQVQVNDWENFTDDQIGKLTNAGGLAVGPHEVDWGLQINNNVTMTLNSGETISKDTGGNYFLAYGDRAHAQTESQIYKYQSGHFNIGLPNAHFALYKYSKGGEKSTVSLDLITNENGMISLSSLEKGVLYEVIETIAPTGYAKLSAPCYFAYINIPDSSVLQAAKVTENQVQLLQKGDNIEIANTKVLPQTGSVGSEPIIFIGMSIMTSSAIIYFLSKGRKRCTKR